MSRTRNALVFVALALVAATPALAGFQETITKGEGFPADPRELGRIAIFVTECDPALDCSRLVAFAIQETADSDVGITVVPETSVRQALFSAGKTAYDPEMREALMEELELGGVLEIHVPHAERSDGFGGRTKSQVKVEMARQDTRVPARAGWGDHIYIGTELIFTAVGRPSPAAREGRRGEP
jgi:hypothetical protein